MNDKTQHVLLQSLDSLMPLLLSALPQQTRDKHICSIVYEAMKNFATIDARKLASQLVYVDDNCSPFSALVSICEYLNELVTSKDEYKSNCVKIKRLNKILLLPSEEIINRNITFKLASLDVTETIRRAVSNGYTHEVCDKTLHFLHTLIFNFLSLKINEISVAGLTSTVEQLYKVNKF